MRILLWTLGCLSFCLALMLGAFEVFSYFARGAWQLVTTDQVFLALTDSSIGMAEAFATLFQGQAWVDTVNSVTLQPLASIALLPILAAVSLLLLMLGRHREPDFF